MRNYSRREALASSLLGAISLGLPGAAWAGSPQAKQSRAEAEGLPAALVTPPKDASAVTGLLPRFALRALSPADADGWFNATDRDVLLDVYVRNDSGAPRDLWGQEGQGASTVLTATHGGISLAQALPVTAMTRMMPRPQWIALAAGVETLLLTQRLTPPDGVAAADLDLAVQLRLQLRDGRLELQGKNIRLQPELG